jgi:Nuclease-related domain/UvrD-like helicase C-terminal domain/AAA domain
MAKMYPSKILAGTQSNAERKVYFALKDNLPDTFSVFHSVPLLVRSQKAPALLPKEIDFLVCHLQHGLLVIEVKGGGISCDGPEGVWTSTSSDGLVHEIKNPYGQAQSALFALLDELRDCGIGKKNRFPIAYAVWFPDIELKNTPLGRSTNYPDITFDSFTLADPKDPILYVLVKCLIRTAPIPPGPEGLQTLVKYLAPKWQVPLRLGTALREEEKAFFEATRSQYKVLSMLGRKHRALICGAAGSGKTFLALEKAHTLANAGNDVLLLCYNQRLAEWLRSQTSPSDNITVFHYHGLCAYLCQLAGQPLPKPDPLSATRNFFAAELPEALLNAIAATERRFDGIIVDEGQDFEALWWISSQELLKDPAASPLYIFYDDNQHIYSTRFDFPIKEEPLLLCENCRNTRKIHAEVMKSYRGNSEYAAIGPEGRNPVEIQVAGDQEERTAVENAVRELLTQENVPIASIVILTPKAQARSKWREGEKLAGHPLSWSGPCPGGAIACATIHAFKGLESPVVIMTEMAEPDTHRLRQLSYVGCSRASSHLIIVRPRVF